MTSALCNRSLPAGKSIMLWGDMLLQHPAALRRAARRLKSSTGPTSPPIVSRNAAKFTARSLATTVCPSVRGFGLMFNAVAEARDVIAAYARTGHQHGARGLLNTDWGDYGHFNMPPAALHGLALGAQLAWNPHNDAHAAFDRAFSRVLFNAPDSRPAELFTLAGSVPPVVAAWPFAPLRGLPRPADPAPLRKIAAQAEAWAAEFAALPASPWTDETDLAQLALACRFLRLGALLAADAPAAETRPLHIEYTLFTEIV